MRAGLTIATMGWGLLALLSLPHLSGCSLGAECTSDFDCEGQDVCARDKTCQPLPEDQATGGGGGGSVSELKARIKIESINGQPVGDEEASIAPLDDVRLTGTESTAPGNSFGSVQWTFLTRPPESSMEFTDPTALTTGFVFNSASGDVNGIDVAGFYEIQLEVKGQDNPDLSDKATISFEAVPGDDLHVQLTWDVPTGDVDLHFRRVGTDAYCAPTSCYFASCTTGGSPPDWDGDGSSPTSGDPTLDIDDLEGFGPENINVLTPQDGQYEVGVHYYNNDTPNDPPTAMPTTATVKIYDKGSLRLSESRLLSWTNDSWRVATITWANGTAAVEAIGAFQEQDSLCNIEGQPGMSCSGEICIDDLSCGTDMICQ
jgi:hypothetical protein